MKQSFQETRTEVIVRYVREALHRTRMSETTFSLEVIERYHQTVAEEARVVTFKSDGDPFAVATTNKQRLFRMLDVEFPDTRLPADLEESIVNSLPEAQYLDCRRELARRYGLSDVPLPEEGAAAGLRSIGAFTAALGAAMEAIAPIVADGKIDSDDVPHAARALQMLEQLNNQSIALRQQIQMQIGSPSK